MDSNQSTLILNNSHQLSIITKLTDSKIIIVNPIRTTNCEQNSEVSSIFCDYSEAKESQNNSEKISPDMQKPLQLMIEDQPSGDEEENQSMRKLYKQIKRQEIEHQVMFLYKSDRGEVGLKQQPVSLEQEEDQKNQPDIMIVKNSSEIINRLIPIKKMVECIVKIASRPFFSFQKQYQIYLLKEKKLLLKAYKNKLPLVTQFTVQTAENKKVAIFQSNLSRTQYKYYGWGNKLAKNERDNKKQSDEAFDSNLIKLNPIKIQLNSLQSSEKCYLFFRSNLFGTKQQRMKIIRPKAKIYKSERFSDIKSSYENFEYDRLQIFESRLAEKNHKGQLVMDFKTKNIMESTKNMIIEDENGDVCLSFYKRREGIYMLTIINPLTIIEAFFVAVSNLDHIFF